MRGFLLVALLLGAGHEAFAAETHTTAGEPAPPSRYRLERSIVEPAAQEGGRYRVRARIAPAEQAGELREGDNFVLIGRIAPKAASGCSTSTLFRNGFE